MNFTVADFSSCDFLIAGNQENRSLLMTGCYSG
jgi:hypothetical protein